jgi:hypothetical protein
MKCITAGDIIYCPFEKNLAGIENLQGWIQSKKVYIPMFIAKPKFSMNYISVNCELPAHSGPGGIGLLGVDSKLKIWLI